MKGLSASELIAVPTEDAETLMKIKRRSRRLTILTKGSFGVDPQCLAFAAA